MSTLAVDTPRVYQLTGAHPDYDEVPIIAADTVFEGAVVGESSSAGTGRPLVAGDNFLGFCQENCNNEGGAAAAKMIKVLSSGYVWLTVTNGDNIDDRDVTVYASDDSTFTTASTGNSAIGKLRRYDATRTQKCLVYFESANRRSI